MGGWWRDDAYVSQACFINGKNKKKVKLPNKIPTVVEAHIYNYIVNCASSSWNSAENKRQVLTTYKINVTVSF